MWSPPPFVHNYRGPYKALEVIRWGESNVVSTIKDAVTMCRIPNFWTANQMAWLLVGWIWETTSITSMYKFLIQLRSAKCSNHFFTFMDIFSYNSDHNLGWKLREKNRIYTRCNDDIFKEFQIFFTGLNFCFCKVFL